MFFPLFTALGEKYRNLETFDHHIREEELVSVFNLQVILVLGRSGFLFVLFIWLLVDSTIRSFYMLYYFFKEKLDLGILWVGNLSRGILKGKDNLFTLAKLY